MLQMQYTKVQTEVTAVSVHAISLDLCPSLVVHFCLCTVAAAPSLQLWSGVRKPFSVFSIAAAADVSKPGTLLNAHSNLTE
jgi:hypothetical protein